LQHAGTCGGATPDEPHALYGRSASSRIGARRLTLCSFYPYPKHLHRLGRILFDSFDGQANRT
jgi:hypothetical protein